MSFIALFSQVTVLPYPFGPAGGAGDAGEGYRLPPADVHETPSDVVVELDLPGIAAHEVRIGCEGGTLRIEGVTGEAGGRGVPAPSRALCLERAAGALRRVVERPAAVSPDRGSARFRDGVLVVTLPKSAPGRRW